MGTFLKAVKAGWAKLKKALAAAWRWYKGQFAGRPWWRKTLAAIVSFFAFILLYAVAVTCNLFWLFGKSPSISEIRNPKTAMASEMYSADGKLLGKFFNENRSPVPYDSINSVFFQALISTEDERFYDHHGVDVQGLFAALKDATQGRARGASTISQQLVKNMFRVRTQYSTGLLGKVPGLSILIMKSKEMIIATELELLCTKNEILEMYANTVDFGSNAFGIKTAAKTYFNTTPSQLKPEEAAVLVGLLKATSAYNPKINPKNSLKRRNTVLDNMYAHRKELAEHFPNVAITSKEVCEALKDKPIKLNFSVENAYQGTALYFREAVKDYVREHCPDLDLDRDGLKIYTTLDSRMQRYAEEAVDEQMQNVQRSFDNHWRGLGDPWRDAKGNVIPNFIEDIARRSDAYKMLVARYPNNPDSVRHYMNKPHPVKLFGYGEKGRVKYEEMSTMDSIRYMVKYMHTGFVAMEPQTGYVRAYVGDIDFKTWKYDKVQAMRQPGSTFKLFVYATAMKQGWTPADARITDSYIRMEVYDPAQGKNTIWQPHNANGHFSNANIPLRAAFAQSVNTIAVKLGQEVGIDNVIQTAHDMGITSKLENAPALALGSNDVTLFEMVNAYASVANDGMHVSPVLVTKIVDADGRTVYEAKHEERRALPYRAAFYMQKLLEAGVRDGGGTSQTLGGSAYLGRYGNQLDFGGKTGTSNNHSDAWFIGVTPGLVGGAWVGGEYRSIHFRTGRLGQGSRTALPIFGLFMKKVLEDESLKGKYLLKYPAPKEDIEPSTYQGYFAPPAEEADSLSADSTLVGDDLMGTGADPAAEQPAGKAAEAADENAANNLFE
ncbi:MAG: transglycosylase domain-containing protein [Bacteroidales bacterium]|nr:transglycosylase domain-containing protein [Bacteroidales bacterium]